MSAVQRRFAAVIGQIGDSYTVGARTGKGIFVMVSAARAAIYATDAELSGAGRPLRMVYLRHDDPTAASESMSYAGLSFTVRKVIPVLFRDETILKLAIIG